MDQQCFQKYQEKYGIRFNAKQKHAVREELTAEFARMGFSTLSLGERKRWKRVDNFVCGSFRHARNVIVIPYDTPRRVFWHNSRYYPLNGTRDANKGLLPFLTPVIVLYALLFGILPWVERSIQNPLWIRLTAFGCLAVLALLIYYVLHGAANHHNANRNTAGIAAAIEIARSLDTDQRRNTAFLFLDGNHGRFYGAEAAAAAWQKEHRKPQMIVLNTFAHGSVMQIGYRQEAKKAAMELQQLSETIHPMKAVAMSDGMVLSTPMQHFPRAIAIAAGELDAKGELCAWGTATAKDREVDPENVDAVVALITAYLKKQKRG